MDYTTKTNHDDMKRAGKVFGRYFNTYSNFRRFEEELKQIAVMEMWKFRMKAFNGYKKLLPSGLSKVAHDAMRDFLRKECKYLNNTFSVFDEIVDGMIVEDLLDGKLKASCDLEPEHFYAYQKLRGQVRDVENTFNELGKQIIQMYLNRRSYAEIAKCCDTTKPNVQKYIRRFREAVSERLVA